MGRRLMGLERGVDGGLLKLGRGSGVVVRVRTIGFVHHAEIEQIIKNGLIRSPGNQGLRSMEIRRM